MTFLKRLSLENLEFKEYQKDLQKQLIDNCSYIKDAKYRVCSSVESLKKMYGHNLNMEILLIHYSNLFEKVNPPIDLKTTRKIVKEANTISHVLTCVKHIFNDDIPTQTRLVMQHFVALRTILGYEGDLSEELIKLAHRVLMKGIQDDEGHDVNEGNYRTEYVAAKHHLFISPEYVPESMTKLVNDFNEAANDESIDPCLLAGWLMMQFLQIHPFNDGNGRMSRILFQFALQKRRMAVLVPLVTPNNVSIFKDCLKHNQRHQEIEKRYSTVWAYSAGCVADAFRSFLKE